MFQGWLMRVGFLPMLVLVLGCGDETDDDPTDPPPPSVASVKFIAVGDTGTGEVEQTMVADAMKAKCDADGCDFVVLLGDNIYETGPTAADDQQFADKFETPYAAFDIPFYAVLGNHDYGDTDMNDGNKWAQGQAEVGYADSSSKLTMPSTFYTFTEKGAGFVALDTNALLWDDTTNGDQRAWFDDAVGELNTEWHIGFGHHAYYSNGVHRNMGEYGIFDPNPGVEIKEFFDTSVCGSVDAYICGHDHHLEWLTETLCGAELMVSGAGSKVRNILNMENEDHFIAAEFGFLYVVIEGSTFTGQFISSAGAVLFERSFERPSM